MSTATGDAFEALEEFGSDGACAKLFDELAVVAGGATAEPGEQSIE